MADRVIPGPVDGAAGIREAVCVHTRKVFDSCRDKDCVEDLAVYPTTGALPTVLAATSIRPRACELLGVQLDVDEISFNRGFYTVDVRYWYRIRGEAYPSSMAVEGLAVFDKRVILFGSEGSVKVYSSDGEITTQADQPVGVVEAVDPIALAMQLTENAGSGGADMIPDIPPAILAAFGEDLVLNDAARLWYTTLGQFSLIRLERDSQLVIPVYNYSVPENECAGTTDDDPCTLFGRIRFPVEEFYPPDSMEPRESYRGLMQ